jgi:hypothetical protein
MSNAEKTVKIMYITRVKGGVYLHYDAGAPIFFTQSKLNQWIGDYEKGDVNKWEDYMEKNRLMSLAQWSEVIKVVVDCHAKELTHE